MTQYIPKSFSLLSLFLFIELFLNLWICALGWCWSCGRKHADDWRFAVGGPHSIFSVCAQWNELGKRWCFLNAFCLNFMVMDLKSVSGYFSEQPNGNGWCQHKILGGENQKSWTSEPATIISVLCKSRRRHWRWLLQRWV